MFFISWQPLLTIQDLSLQPTPTHKDWLHLNRVTSVFCAVATARALMHACMPRLAFISITATSWEVMLVFSLSAGCPPGNVMLYSTGIHSKGYPTPSTRLTKWRVGHLRLVDMLTGPNILVFIQYSGRYKSSQNRWSTSYWLKPGPTQS